VKSFIKLDSFLYLNLFANPGHVPKARTLALGLSGHQFLVAVVLDKGHDAGDAGLAVHKAPGEAANGATLVQEQVNVPTYALSVDDAVGEKLDVHQLVLAIIKALGQRLTVLLPKMSVSLFGLAGHPVTDNSIHGMVG
jgi:hypothetical protein